MKIKEICGSLVGVVFPVTKKKTLKDVAAEDLRRERIKMEQTESRINGEVEKLEREKAAFFSKGVGCPSDRQKMQYARKVKELDGQIRGMDKQLSLIGRNLRVLNGVIQLKENDRLLRDMGVDGMLAAMDLSDVQDYVDRCTLDGQFQMEQFTSLLDAVDEAEDIFKVDGADSDTEAIVRAMCEAEQIGTSEAARDALDQASQSLRTTAENQEGC